VSENPSPPSRPSSGGPEIGLKNAPGSAYAADSMNEPTLLMTAAKHGDRDAFNRLVESLRSRAFTVAQGLVGSREDALELSQEAFLKTYRARDTYRDGEPFLPWFHRILRNTCYSYLRKNGRLAKRSLSPHFGDERAEDTSEWDIADDEAAPSEVLEQNERAQAFWRAFRTLSARDREILSLRHFKELAYQDIADALEIPIGTVMSRLFHARRRLRDALGDHLDDEEFQTRGPAPAPVRIKRVTS
jgi:RNA polymerase sigma-70 factor, ECF subfamily